MDRIKRLNYIMDKCEEQECKIGHVKGYQREFQKEKFLNELNRIYGLAIGYLKIENGLIDTGSEDLAKELKEGLDGKIEDLEKSLNNLVKKVTSWDEFWNAEDDKTTNIGDTSKNIRLCVSELLIAKKLYTMFNGISAYEKVAQEDMNRIRRKLKDYIDEYDKNREGHEEDLISAYDLVKYFIEELQG